MIHFVVMGVAGCGKSTVAEAIAGRFQLPCIEGDALHDPASIEKMSRGEALTDADRWPWLERIGEHLAQSDVSVVISCSALRKVYRDRIRLKAGSTVAFIHLAADQSVIAGRMAKRTGHFMPVSLLSSQFNTLESLSDDETGVTIDIAQSLEQVLVDSARYVERALT
ncbi:hypothetical protein AB833_22895 [Chromatiales bacterium (ex Bugula neritina AB1)]|nr:hypothetical protein AB833_22895 [Chromatiales bacterium (ex Bugula neritina AB1)]